MSNLTLAERLTELRKALASRHFTRDECAWLVDTCDALRRQGNLLCNQAEGQIEQFRYVTESKAAHFPKEEP